LRHLLQKGFGWKRTRHSHRGKQDPEQKQLKQADLNTLKLAAQEGYIDLKYLDESGCCLWSPVSYSYSRIGEQKRSKLNDEEDALAFWGFGNQTKGLNMRLPVAVSTVQATSQ